MNRILLSVAAAALCLSTVDAQQSQTLPRGYDTVAGGSGSSFPFNSTSDHKWQWHYDSGEFDATGPIQITKVSVRTLPTAGTIASFDFPSLQLTMASSPTDYTVAGNGIQPGHDPVFANNLNADETLVRPASPWTGSNIPAQQWISFDLTTPFVYDPSLGDDFVFQIEKCGTNISWGQSIDGTPFPGPGPGLNGGNRYGDTTNCAATIQSFFNDEFVPIILIEYGPVGPSLTSSGSPGGSMSFDLSGLTASGAAAIVYGPAGSYTVPGGGCAGLVVDLLPVNFPPLSSLIIINADANGDAQLTQNVPAGGAGLTVQGVDVQSCTATNAIVL